MPTQKARQGGLLITERKFCYMATKKKIIDTGLVEFKLPFDRGTEKIYFNPNDVEFFVRLSDMINSISGLYDEYSVKYEATSDNAKKLSIIHELNDKIKEAFDEAFGNKVSDVIFKYVSPHGIVAGNQYFSFYILDYLLPEIEEATGKASQATTAELEKAINKHAGKYQHKMKR